MQKSSCVISLFLFLCNEDFPDLQQLIDRELPYRVTGDGALVIRSDQESDTVVLFYICTLEVYDAAVCVDGIHGRISVIVIRFDVNFTAIVDKEYAQVILYGSPHLILMPAHHLHNICWSKIIQIRNTP